MRVRPKMYPEEGGAEPAPMGGVKGTVTKNLEALIPLILIVIIVAFIGHRFGYWEIPFLGGTGQAQMLIIGQPSADLLRDLDNRDDLVYYRMKNASDLDTAPKEQLAQYNIVLLDQHILPQGENKISGALGEALQNYVRTGGKLVIVMDSGIYLSGGIYGSAVATDVIGWKKMFGDLVPVECDTGLGNVKTCKQPIVGPARIHRIDFDHKIMEGIEIAPADPSYGPLTVETFNVKATGHLIAQIKPIGDVKNFPGIVEKKLLVGKVLYFNYDPAMTPGIWQNTLEYLR